MRAMRVSRPAPATTHPLERIDGQRPAPEAGELLVRVAACAVCRTDLQLCEGDLAAHRLPIIPGHQIVGHVEALGPGVAGWQVGDRAGIAWLAWTCGQCARCR